MIPSNRHVASTDCHRFPDCLILLVCFLSSVSMHISAQDLSPGPQTNNSLHQDVTYELDVPCDPSNQGECSTTIATVFRDANGIPHIEAPDQPTAWYAMGYEEARDALYHVQVAVMHHRGTKAKYFGDTPANIKSDVIARLLQYNLAENPLYSDINNLMDLLRVDSGTNEYQLFDNLVAYTAGLNKYRQELYDNVVRPDEQPMRTWLIRNQLNWVLTNEITVHDVASWGSWTKVPNQFAVAELTDVTVEKTLYPDLSDQETRSDSLQRLDPATLMKNLNPGHQSSGSNSFAWSHHYTRETTPEGTVEYSGLLGDPMAPRPSFAYPDAVQPDGNMTHVWYVHLKVDDGSDSMNVFGYLEHGAGVMFLCHNDNIAVGGSAGTPNVSDAFLLRVKADIQSPVGWSYYSYYEDTGGDNGNAASDWVPFTERTVRVELKGGGFYDRTFWDAGPFGVVHHPEPFLSNRDWVYDQYYFPGKKNEFIAMKPNHDENEIPVVVAYRIPCLQQVDGAQHNFRLSVGKYEVMRANSIYDIAAQILDRDWTFNVNICAIDREGRLMATMLSAIPRRGYDDEMWTYGQSLELDHGFYGCPEKYGVYDKFNTHDPVPARFKEEEVFDWAFETDHDPNTPLKYLSPMGIGSENNKDYLPYVFYDPDNTNNCNPIPAILNYDPVDFHFQNMGFVSESNDQIWHSYQKRQVFGFFNTTPPHTPPAGQNPFNAFFTTPENNILDQVLESGTMYHTMYESFEAREKQQNILEPMTDILKFLAIGAGHAPMTIMQTLEYAMSNRNYAAPDYIDPEHPEYATMPVRARILKELYDGLDDQGPGEPGLLSRANKEVKFFKDLWEVLHDPPAGWANYEIEGTTTVVNLRDVWVNGFLNGVNQIFWYPYQGTVQYIDMPAELPLIDFHWQGSFYGHTAGELSGLTAAERTELDAMIAMLAAWDGHNDIDSPEAALLAQYELGFNADIPNTDASYPGQSGRRWLPLFAGQVMGEAEEAVQEGLCPVAPEYFALTSDGAIPDLGGQKLQYFFKSFSDFSTIAKGSTTLHDPFTVNKFIDLENDDFDTQHAPQLCVYDALYEENSNHTVVRATLEKNHINVFAKFFLKLGGFWNDGTPGDPSDKLDLWELANDTNKYKCRVEPVGLYAFTELYAPGYPLTRNVANILVLRRLLDAEDQMAAWYEPMASYGEIFRSRLFSYDGIQRWPLDPFGRPIEEGEPCNGPGIGHVGCHYEGEDGAARKKQKRYGFQERMWCFGNSNWPMLTLFPKDHPELPPISRFNHSPGERIMLFTSYHFKNMMDYHCTRTLADTHFTDYQLPENASPEYVTPIEIEYVE